MSTYSAFPVYPAIAGTMSNTLYTPNAAVGGTLRITLTGTTFSVRIQINNEQVTTGQPHLFLPSEAGWETKATVMQAGMPTDILAPARWVRLIVDSGSVAGGTVEEMDIRASTTVDLTARAGVTSTQSAIGNTALGALSIRAQTDGPQFVDGSRWLWSNSGTPNAGTVLAAVDAGFWAREYVGAIYLKWFGILPTNTAAQNGAAMVALLGTLTAAGQRIIIQTEAGTYLFDRAFTIPLGVTLKGQGQGATTFQCTVDTGGPVERPVPFIVLTAGSINTSARMEGVLALGPNFSRTIGVRPCNGGGILVRSQSVLRDVSAQFFSSGLMIDGDHQQIQAGCIFTNNYYNVHFCDVPGNIDGTPSASYTAGDQSFIYTDMTGATFASICVGLKNQMLSVIFVGGHTGFSPFSFYRPTGVALNPMMYGCTFNSLSHEGVGNGAIRDDSTSGGASIIGCNWTGRVGSNWYDVFNLNTYTRDYCVDVRGLRSTRFEMGSDAFTARPGGASIGAIRDRDPAGTPTGTRLIYNDATTLNGNSFSGLNLAAIEVAGASGFISTTATDLYRGEPAEILTVGTVRRWGTTSTSTPNPFCGIGLFDSGATGCMAVINKGMVLAQVASAPAQGTAVTPAVQPNTNVRVLAATAGPPVGYNLVDNAGVQGQLRLVNLT